MNEKSTHRQLKAKISAGFLSDTDTSREGGDAMLCGEAVEPVINKVVGKAYAPEFDKLTR